MSVSEKYAALKANAAAMGGAVRADYYATKESRGKPAAAWEAGKLALTGAGLITYIAGQEVLLGTTASAAYDVVDHPVGAAIATAATAGVITAATEIGMTSAVTRRMRNSPHVVKTYERLKYKKDTADTIPDEQQPAPSERAEESKQGLWHKLGQLATRSTHRISQGVNTATALLFTGSPGMAIRSFARNPGAPISEHQRKGGRATAVLTPVNMLTFGAYGSTLALLPSETTETVINHATDYMTWVGLVVGAKVLSKGVELAGSGVATIKRKSQARQEQQRQLEADEARKEESLVWQTGRPQVGDSLVGRREICPTDIQPNAHQFLREVFGPDELVHRMTQSDAHAMVSELLATYYHNMRQDDGTFIASHAQTAASERRRAMHTALQLHLDGATDGQIVEKLPIFEDEADVTIARNDVPLRLHKWEDEIQQAGPHAQSHPHRRLQSLAAIKQHWEHRLKLPGAPIRNIPVGEYESREMAGQYQQQATHDPEAAQKQLEHFMRTSSFRATANRLGRHAKDTEVFVIPPSSRSREATALRHAGRFVAQETLGMYHDRPTDLETFNKSAEDHLFLAVQHTEAGPVLSGALYARELPVPQRADTLDDLLRDGNTSIVDAIAAHKRTRQGKASRIMEPQRLAVRTPFQEQGTLHDLYNALDISVSRQRGMTDVSDDKHMRNCEVTYVP